MQALAQLNPLQVYKLTKLSSLDDAASIIL